MKGKVKGKTPAAYGGTLFKKEGKVKGKVKVREASLTLTLLLKRVARRAGCFALDLALMCANWIHVRLSAQPRHKPPE
jgi:hypothetical protein